MKNLIPCDKPRIAALADRLKRVGNRAQYQRIQCVLIRATTVGSSPAQIAQLLGWSIASVHLIHSRWVKEGDALLDLHGRTARRHQHLSPTQEAGLLAPFAANGPDWWTPARQRDHQELGRQAQQGRSVRLMFQDEARFGLLAKPRRCGAPAGVRPVLSCWAPAQIQLCVYAAQSTRWCDG